MKKTCLLGILLLTFAAFSAAQEKVFDWVRASDEAAQLDPMDYHAGRVYHPGSDGGNIHVDIHSKLPVTIAMAGSEEWNAASQHPETMAGLEFLCMREHVVNTTYECHLPTGRPMVLLIRDERAPDRAVVRGVVAVFGHGARALLSPNDLKITYYSWSCVENCIQPEYQWSRLVREKYQLTSAPKVYSLLTPERDGQPVWIRIKAPVPMTIALLPSQVADQIYDNPQSLAAALANTACKQRGVQSLAFDCKVNLEDGRLSLVVLPEPRGSVPHKKAEIEMQTQQCIANCEMLNKEPVNH